MTLALSSPKTKRGGPNLIWVLLAVMIALIVAAPALAQAAPAAPVPQDGAPGGVQREDLSRS